VRFSTLAALFEELNCQPNDLLRWETSTLGPTSDKEGSGQ
jgi:DNA-binding Xre family transcriptional regulator